MQLFIALMHRELAFWLPRGEAQRRGWGGGWGDLVLGPGWSGVGVGRGVGGPGSWPGVEWGWGGEGDGGTWFLARGGGDARPPAS